MGSKKIKRCFRSLKSGSRSKGGVLAHTLIGILSIGGENINWDGSLELDKVKIYYLYYWLKGEIYQEYILGAGEVLQGKTQMQKLLKVNIILIPDINTLALLKD